MTSVLLSVGIAVFFLTVWGAVMAGAHMIGRPPQAILRPKLASNVQGRASSTVGSLGDVRDVTHPDARS